MPRAALEILRMSASMNDLSPSDGFTLLSDSEIPSAAQMSRQSSRNGSSESIMSMMSCIPTKFLFRTAPVSVPNTLSNMAKALPNFSACFGDVLEQSIVQNPTAAVDDSIRVAIGKNSEHCTDRVFDQEEILCMNVDWKLPPITLGIEKSCFAYPIASPPFRRLRTEL